MHIELLSIIIGIIQIFSLWKITKKDPLGFILGVYCNIGWIGYVCLAKGSFGIIPVAIATTILHIKGYRSWNEEKQKILQGKRTTQKSKKIRYS